MNTANKKINPKKLHIVIAFALAEPFFDIPETNGSEENDDEDTEALEELEEADLEDLEPIDPALEEDDDYIDLDDEEETFEEIDPAADELGKQVDYIDNKMEPGTDLRDGTTII